MTGDYELTWHKNQENGDYTATDSRPDPPVTYGVARAGRGRPEGRGWMLAAYSQDMPAQFRTGFDTMATARAAALSTRCHLCGRHRPFATMTGNDSIRGWRCRDQEDCGRAAAEKDAEFRQIAAEIRNTPWGDAEIRDTESGPELVIRTDSRNATVITATEGDLDRLLAMLLTRRASRAGHGGDPL